MIRVCEISLFLSKPLIFPNAQRRVHVNLFNSTTLIFENQNNRSPTMASAPAYPSRPFTTGLNRSTAGGSSAPPAQTPQPFNPTTTPIYPTQHSSTQQRGQLERGDRLSAQVVPAQNALGDLTEDQREEINEVRCPEISVGSIDN